MKTYDNTRVQSCSLKVAHLLGTKKNTFSMDRSKLDPTWNLHFHHPRGDILVHRSPYICRPGGGNRTMLGQSNAKPEETQPTSRMASFVGLARHKTLHFPLEYAKTLT